MPKAPRRAGAIERTPLINWRRRKRLPSTSNIREASLLRDMSEATRTSPRLPDGNDGYIPPMFFIPIAGTMRLINRGRSRPRRGRTPTWSVADGARVVFVPQLPWRPLGPGVILSSCA
jgi:hypothetical protein